MDAELRASGVGGSICGPRCNPQTALSPDEYRDCRRLQEITNRLDSSGGHVLSLRARHTLLSNTTLFVVRSCLIVLDERQAE